MHLRARLAPALPFPRSVLFLPICPRDKGSVPSPVLLFSVRFVEVLAWLQVSEMSQVFGPQRFGDGVFATQPLAEINQAAALRAERPERTREPIAAFLTCRADHFFRQVHG